MCEQCWNTVSKLFPEKSDSERVDLLWNVTAFPAGNPETIARQLREYKEISKPRSD